MNREKLLIASGRKWLMLETCDIIFVEVIDHYVLIHDRKQVIKIRYSLEEIEELLKDSDFCRIHRSFLVSLRCVSQYSKNFVKLNDENETKLPIGSRYWDDFEKNISRFEALPL